MSESERRMRVISLGTTDPERFRSGWIVGGRSPCMERDDDRGSIQLYASMHPATTSPCDQRSDTTISFVGGGSVSLYSTR